MTVSQSNGKLYSKTVNQLSVTVDASEIILQTADGVYFSLNDSARDIWEFLDSPRQFGELVDYYLENYDVERETCEEYTADLVHSLLSNNLIEERKL